MSDEEVQNLYGGGSGGDLGTVKRRSAPTWHDSNGRFDGTPIEGTLGHRHTYFRNDEWGEFPYKASATSLINDRAQRFPKEARSKAMFARGDREILGQPVESAQDIMDVWERNGLAAAETGTRGHLFIEKDLNNCADRTGYDYNEDEVLKVALRQWDRCYADHILGKRLPVMLEQNIFGDECVFAGQADAFFTRAEWQSDNVRKNWLICVDWKFSKKNLSPDAQPFGGQRMLGCCSHLLDIKYNHYSIQQTMYAIVFMLKTDYVFVDFYIGQFHPINDDYRWIPVVPLWDVCKRILLENRHKKIGEYRKSSASALVVVADQFVAMAGVTEYADIFDRNDQLDALIKAGDDTAVVAKQLVEASEDARSLSLMLEYESGPDADLDAGEYAKRIDTVIARSKAAMAVLAGGEEKTEEDERATSKRKLSD